MSLVRFEMQKIFSRKLFWGMLLFALALNLFVLYETNKPQSGGAFTQSKDFFCELQTMSQADMLEYLTQQNDLLEAIFLKERIESQDTPSNERLTQKYAESYAKYAEQLSMQIDYAAAHLRADLVQKALTELRQVSGYETYLHSLQTQANTLLNTSVFASNLSGFSRANIEKTARDFSAMATVEIRYAGSAGVLLLADSRITDACMLLLLVTAVLALAVDEKEKRLFSLVRCTPRGLGQTIAAKLTALFACALSCSVVLFACTAAFAAYTYGFGDLTRSVQSIPQMMGSALPLTVGEYIGLLFGLKLIGAFIIGMLVLLFALACRRTIFMLGIVFAAAAGSILLTLIPATAAYNHLKYCNLYTLMNPAALLYNYGNLSIFGKPVRTLFVFAVFSVALFAIFCTGVCLLYCKKRPLENRDTTGHMGRPSVKIHSSLCFFEWKKLFSINRAALLLAVFVLYQGYSIYTQTFTMHSDAYVYRQYMQQLEGPLTTQKEDFILGEQAKLADAQAHMDILTQQHAKGTLTTQEFLLQQEVYAHTFNNADAFSRVYDKYLHIKSQAEATFFFDLGYETLLGIPDNDFSAGTAILLLCMLALCLSGLYSVDYKTGMYQVLAATEKGTQETVKCKQRCALFTASLLFVVAYVPELIYVGRFYGYPALTAPCASIGALSHLGNLPIWACITLLYTLRLAVLWLLVPVISFLSLRSKNNVITTLVFTAVCILPAVLYRTGFAFLREFSLLPLLCGTVVVGGSWVNALQAGVLFFAALGCARFVQRQFGQPRYFISGGSIRWK